MWQYTNTDELQHHGVLGMKWGVRRYQNVNGTYTDAGRKRYIKDKTASITNKKSKEKKRKKAASKYDRVAKKQQRYIDDNNRRVKQYGKNMVKVANNGQKIVTTMMTAEAISGIAAFGGTMIRQHKAIHGRDLKGKAMAAASLAAIGGLAVNNIRTVHKLNEDNRLADYYDDRKNNR